jgi:hypothetical protein
MRRILVITKEEEMKQAMKRVKHVFFVVAILMVASRVCGESPAAADAAAYRSLQVELSGQEHNAIKTSWPAIGCWFPMDRDFQPEGYKQFFDLYAKHSPIKLLTTSIRCKRWMTDPQVHDQMKAAAEYARSLGMGIVLELDWPFARPAFVEKYPDELQGVVGVCEAPLKTTGAVELSRAPLNAHYFWDSKGYVSVTGQVLRVWSYRAGPEGAEAVEDITARALVVQANAQSVKVSIPCLAADEGRHVCLMALFYMYQPDLFAPHLTSFDHDVLRQYADVPLAGVCKDEGGFVPSESFAFPDNLWFSPFLAKAYAERRPSHDLTRDLLLMSKGEKGRKAERAAAINHYMELFWKRNAEIETEYYHAIKSVFGKETMVGTHPTWQPLPCQQEVVRNGLDWWGVTRDLAQTDEVAPYGVRTALAKKWHSPLWYNMYYAGSVKPYESELWANVLGGGRINWHPLWPFTPLDKVNYSLPPVAGKLWRADCRIRLLNYISTRPVDCPVAIVFSHPRACNWAEPGFGDSGWGLCDDLWNEGYYADLIPSSEIASGSLKVSEDGYVQYGPQKYALAVFYHPQYERPMAGAFFRQAAATGKTLLYRTGDWTMDFDGNPVEVKTMLPAQMMELAGSASACGPAIISRLKAAGLEPQTGGRGHQRLRGQCRLLDGTVILASGEKDVMGDPIQKTLNVDGHEVAFDAVGVAAVRLDKDGKLEALAAGGLKRFAVGKTKIELPQRADVALWKDTKGVWQGVLQDYEGEVPADLKAITAHWLRLAVPVSLAQKNANGLAAPAAKIKTATASSQYAAEYDAGKANDGILTDDVQNCWASANQQDIGSWWQADLGATTPIPAIQIQFRVLGDCHYFVPKTITFQVSDDGNTWRTVVSKSTNVPAIGSTPNGKPYEYAIHDKGRYVRLLFEDGTDHRVGDIKVVELVEVRVVKADASAAAAAPPVK